MSEHGKWSQPGVPHKGWRCTHTYDSCEDDEELHMVCEMCERQLIRYVHVMEHDEYPGSLECGCVCAGNMEEDYESAKSREGVLKRLTAGRKKRREQLMRDAARLDSLDPDTLIIEYYHDALSELHGCSHERIARDRDEGITREEEHEHFRQVKELLKPADERLMAKRDADERRRKRQRHINHCADIWLDLEAPEWESSRTGTRTQAFIGKHRVFVYEKHGRYRAGMEIQGRPVEWGRRTYATEEEAMRRCLYVLPRMLKRDGLLMSRDDSEVQSAMHVRRDKVLDDELAPNALDRFLENDDD